MTTDEEFFADLAKQIRDELALELPQQKDEFTAMWFASNVLHANYDTARVMLEKLVKSERFTVRRHVSLTWGRTSRGRVVSDVYRLKVRSNVRKTI